MSLGVKWLTSTHCFFAARHLRITEGRGNAFRNGGYLACLGRHTVPVGLSDRASPSFIPVHLAIGLLLKATGMP